MILQPLHFASNVCTMFSFPTWDHLHKPASKWTQDDFTCTDLNILYVYQKVHVTVSSFSHKQPTKALVP